MVNICCNYFNISIWLMVWNPLKNISQLGWLFPIYVKLKKCSKPPTSYVLIYLGCFKLFHLPLRSAWLLLGTQNIFSAGKKTPTETSRPKPMIPSIKSIKPLFFFTSLVAQLDRNCNVLLLLLRLPLRGQDWAFLRHRRGHVLYGLAHIVNGCPIFGWMEYPQKYMGL